MPGELPEQVLYLTNPVDGKARVRGELSCALARRR